MKSLNEPQPGWAREVNDIFPLFISFQNLLGESLESLHDAPVLVYRPHTLFRLYHNWYGSALWIGATYFLVPLAITAEIANL